MRTDHLLHALAAFAIAMVVTAVLHACGIALASVWGAEAALLAGAVKELYDLLIHKGTPEMSDFAADVVGVVVAIVTFMMLGL